MDTCNDLGFPAVCFSSLHWITSSPLCCLLQRSHSNQYCSHHFRSNGILRWYRHQSQRGEEKDSTSFPPGCPSQPHTANWGEGDEQRLWKTLPLAEGMTFSRKSFPLASRKVHPSSTQYLHCRERTGFLSRRELCFLQHLSDPREPLVLYQTLKSQRAVKSTGFLKKKSASPCHFVLSHLHITSTTEIMFWRKLVVIILIITPILLVRYTNS